MTQRRLFGVLTASVLFAASAAGAATDDSKPSFKKADANGDGKVSIQEAVNAGATKKEAKNADLNGDGKLTKTDWRFVDMRDKS